MAQEISAGYQSYKGFGTWKEVCFWTTGRISIETVSGETWQFKPVVTPADRKKVRGVHWKEYYKFGTRSMAADDWENPKLLSVCINDSVKYYIMVCPKNEVMAE